MHSRRHLFIIAGMAVILLFIKLGTVSVFQVAEARNSQVPVEMMQSKDYVVPFFNGVMRTDKPPLHYYAMIAAYKIIGIHEAGARFFSAICGLVVIIATWFFVKRNAGIKTAWWSSLILLASLHTIFQFRLATPDPYLIFCHVLSLYCFWEGYKSGRKRYFFAMYVLWGLAILAKGPVGVLLPSATIFFYLLFSKKLNWKTFRSFQPFLGLVTVLLIAVPWFYLVHCKTNGQWTNDFLLQHNVGRFSKTIDGRHKGPFFLPFIFIIAGLFPFSLFMIRAIGFTWQQRKQNGWLFFNLLAVACIVISYSLAATKLINYISPAYPSLAIIIGFYMVNYIRSASINRKSLLPEWIILSVIGIALPVAMFYWMSSESELYPERALSSLLLVFPIGVILGFYHHLKGSFYKSFMFIAAGGIVQSILFFSILYPALDAQGSVQKQKSMIAAASAVVAYRNFNNAFTFYYKKPIVILPSATAVSDYLKLHPSALVLEKASWHHLKDSLPQLSVLNKDKDLFSRQYSIIYQWKGNQ